MGKTGQNPKIGQLWCPVALQPYIIQNSWPDLRNSLSLGLQRGVNSISLQCIPWPVACSEWGTCLIDFLFQILKANDPYSENFPKMSFRIPWQDTKIRFMTKFGKSWPLRSTWKVFWFTIQKKLALHRTRPNPILPKMGQSCPKLPECCHPMTCPRIPNLIRIDCVLPDVLLKDWFFSPKSQSLQKCRKFLISKGNTNNTMQTIGPKPRITL